MKLIARYQSRDAAYLQLRRPVGRYDDLPAPLGALARRLSRLAATAGINTRLQVVAVWMAGVGAAVFAGTIVAAMVLGIRVSAGTVVLALALAAAAGFGLPCLWLARKAAQRQVALTAQFPMALDIFVRSLKAGHPGYSALRILEREMADPLGSEFGLVSDEIGYGLEMRDALQNMAERCASADVDMFVLSVAVQQETGGNLADILQNLATVIRDRASMALKVKALSSEGRMTGTVLTGLPLVTFVGLFTFNPGFYLSVANDPAFLTGFAVLVTAYLAGVAWIRRLTTLKV